VKVRRTHPKSWELKKQIRSWLAT